MPILVSVVVFFGHVSLMKPAFAGCRTTCNARPYSFKLNRLLTGPELMVSHGLRVDLLNISMLTSLQNFSQLHGNCMRPPVVGAVIAACLAFIDFGAGRAHLTAPRPTSFIEFRGDLSRPIAAPQNHRPSASKYPARARDISASSSSSLHEDDSAASSGSD
jgi:hypothetical protein